MSGTRNANEQQQRPPLDLEAELCQREREIELLKDTVTAVASELDLDRVFALIVERARELIQAETLLVPVLDADLLHYTYRAGSGVHADEIVGQSLPLDFGVCGWVWRHKRAWWRGVLDDLEPDERNRWEKEVGSLILVPMVGRRHFLGGLAGMNKIGGADFSRQDLNLLSLFAGHASIAIENAIAYAELVEAKRRAETYQTELRLLNNQLVSINGELERLSLYDQLTGLPNRSLFQDRLQQALYAADRKASGAAVLLLDIDGFKDVNDTVGHAAGDQLLVQAADRLSRQLRHSDTVGRLGGDEFALVLPDTDEERAGLVASALLKSLEGDFSVNGTRLSVAASIGIALYPAHGTDAGTLMQHADVAMYVAKRTRYGFAFYDAAAEVLPVGRLSLVGDLRQALANDEFELYYQPKVDLRSGTLYGVEALARWQDPRRGSLPPDEFIPVLEQTGLIRPFTLWAIERALQQCAAWHAAGLPLTIAVNLSIHSLLDANFASQLVPLLERWMPPMACLILEITESVFLSEHARVESVLVQLRKQGVLFSVDDFGTGHSSLSRLKRLPVSELKIDRSFIEDMERDRDDAAIVRSTIDLAHNLGLNVIAEGVGNASTLTMLEQMGCDAAQGFYISEPLPVPEFERRVKTMDWRLPDSL